MAPREHDVELLELCRGGEGGVGIERGIGQELLTDNGEQIFARQATLDLFLLSGHHHRIGVEDKQRLDRSLERQFAGQGRPQTPLVNPGRARPDPVGPTHSVPVNRKGPNWHMQDTATTEIYTLSLSL